MWSRRQCLTRAGPDGPFQRAGSLATPRSRGRRRRPPIRSGGLLVGVPGLVCMCVVCVCVWCVCGGMGGCVWACCKGKLWGLGGAGAPRPPLKLL
jgi:hypothetical protein